MARHLWCAVVSAAAPKWLVISAYHYDSARLIGAVHGSGQVRARRVWQVATYTFKLAVIFLLLLRRWRDSSRLLLFLNLGRYRLVVLPIPDVGVPCWFGQGHTGVRNEKRCQNQSAGGGKEYLFIPCLLSEMLSGDERALQ